MFRRYLFPVLAASALVGVGCVPVTEPVGNIDKAEPDNALVGKWTVTRSRGLAEVFKVQSLTIDVPDVKGNPKGLMRAVMKANNDGEVWFHITTVGKHTYANTVLESKDSNADFQSFKDEGAFAKWKNEANKRYFVFRYVRDGDALTIDCGSTDAFGALMKDEKIDTGGGKPIDFFATPAGWLAKYFEKNGPEKLFDGTNSLELKREKK